MVDRWAAGLGISEARQVSWPSPPAVARLTSRAAAVTFPATPRGCQDVDVSVVRINAIEVAGEKGDELAGRFAARAGAVDKAPGFEGFELLRPTDGRSTWLVVTRWRDEQSFNDWVASPAFTHGHRGADAPSSQDARPVASSSELWSYEVVDLT